MALPPRGLQISRRSWLLAGLGVPLFRAQGADAMTVLYDGDNLHVSAPTLHFLTADPLKRLKDGATVVFASLLTLYSDRFVTPIRHSEGRFVLSYDIFQEDQFSVTMKTPVARSASSLSAAATEAWCLENLAIGTSGMAPDRQFWIRLDMRAVSKKDEPDGPGGSTISVRSLIEILSRKPGPGDPLWSAQAGPLRLSDLTRMPGRGRNG